MFAQRSKTLIAALLASVIIASCGGSDSSTRQRNAALEGKQQCLSDSGTTISNTGLVQLDFCPEASSFEILENGTPVTERLPITPGAMNNFQVPAGARTYRVLTFNSDDVQVGEDMVSTVTNSCATGGPCKLGDTGPGGGVVVYDAEKENEWGQYIEIARKGWYDRSEGPSASDDPRGRFNCIPDSLGTAEAIGQGKKNTNKMIAECKTPNLDNIDAFSLIDLYNSHPNTAKNDWAIPTPSDLLAIERSYTAISALQFPQYLATSSEAQNPGWIYLYSFGRKNLLACPGNCITTTKRSATSVRPVRYFASSGPVKATVTVVGIMDIPTTTEMPATTTTQVSVPADPYPAPTDVTITGGEVLKVNWTSQVSEKGQSFVVSYQLEGSSDVVSSSVVCCEKTYPFSIFRPNKSYSFVVSLIDNKGEKVSAEPIAVTPVINLNNPDVGVLPDTEGSLELGPVADSPSEETSQTTSPTVDCNVAPSVKYSLNPTSDDTIPFVVSHPCFDLYKNSSIWFGRAIEGVDDVKFVTNYLHQMVRNQSTVMKARLNPGVYTYFFSAQFDTGNELITSDRQEVTLTVASGKDSAIHFCNNNSIKLSGTELTVACPEIRSHTISDYKDREFPSTADSEKVVADLSGLSSGWHTVQVSIGYGLEYFYTQIQACIKECSLNTSFDPYVVTVTNDTLTATSECSGVVTTQQMYKASDNLYLNSAYHYAKNESTFSTSLQPSTAAILFSSWCAENDSELRETFASLNRPTSAPSAEDVTPSSNEITATISLIDLTKGITELPVGEIAGDFIAVAPTTEYLSLSRDVVSQLLDLTVEGSKVTKVEVSTDGRTWLPADIGKVKIGKDDSMLSVRLTAENGTQTVITREIERGAPAIVSAPESSDGGLSTMTILLSIFGLLALVAIALLVRKKRAA